MPAKRGPVRKQEAPAEQGATALQEAHNPNPAQSEGAGTPGLKKMTRADFVEFITKLYSPNDSAQIDEDEPLMNEQALNNAINFLKGFKTNPENMADIIKSKGTPENPLMGNHGLVALASILINDQREILAQSLKANKITKKENIDKIKINNLTELLYIMNVFQQELTNLQLSTVSKYLIYKPNPVIGLKVSHLSFFEEVFEEKRKSKNSVDEIAKRKAEGLTKLAFPEKKNFGDKYDEISKQMMENSIDMMTRKNIPLYKRSDDAISIPHAHLIPAMNKKTFVDAVKYLQIEPKIFIEEAIPVCLDEDGGWHEDSANLMWNLMWSPEFLETINFSIGCHPLQKILEFSARLFQRSYISNYKNYRGMNLGDDRDVRSEYINNVVKLSGALVTKTKASEKTQCQLIDVTDQTPIALLHKKFAAFTVQNVSYLSMMQDCYAVNAYITILKKIL